MTKNIYVMKNKMKVLKTSEMAKITGGAASSCGCSVTCSCPECHPNDIPKQSDITGNRVGIRTTKYEKGGSTGNNSTSTSSLGSVSASGLSSAASFSVCFF